MTQNMPVYLFFNSYFTLQDLPKPIRANFILNVETDELFITAGLQDRVVQVRNTIITTQMSIIFNVIAIVAWIVCPLVSAGLWRLSLHGFQQEAHGRARLWYWSHRLSVDAKWMIREHYFPNVCVPILRELCFSGHEWAPTVLAGLPERPQWLRTHPQQHPTALAQW